MHHRPVALFSILLLAAIAGCVTPPPEATTTPTPGGQVDAMKPFALNFTAPKCIETDVLFFLDEAALQKSLPQGFKTADATTLFALPVATGKGVGLIANIVCAESSIGPIRESSVAILVETPKVNGSREKAIFDFYEPYRYVDATNMSDVFTSVGWDWALGNITATLDATGGGGTTKSNESSIVTFTIRTPPSGNAIDGIGRFWKATPSGLAYYDYKFKSEQRLGSIECALTAGSPFAKVVGVTACTPENSAGMYFTTYKLDASIVNLPGATVG